MDRQKLHDEIALDPLGIGYAQMLNDATGDILVAALNAPSQHSLQPISAQTAMLWAASGPYARIVDAGNNSAHPARASCLVVQETLRANLPIALDQPGIQALLTGWVATGIVTQAEHDTLIVIGTQTTSRAQILGLGNITQADIIAAGFTFGT